MAPVRPPPLSDVYLAPAEASFPLMGEVEQPPVHATGTLLGRTSNFMSIAGKKPGEAAAATPVKPLTALDAECMASPGGLRRTPVAAFTPISTPSPSQRCSLFSRHGWTGSTSGLCLASLHGGPQEVAEGGEGGLLGPRQPGLQPGFPIEAQDSSRQVVNLQQALRTLGSQALGGKQVAATVAQQQQHQGTTAEEWEEDSEAGDVDDQERLRTLECAPRPPPGALHPSLGSEGHALGVCKRCCFFPRGRCMNGYNCEFCHYEHEKRKRKNKKGSKVFGAATLALPPHLRGLLPQPPQIGAAATAVSALQPAGMAQTLVPQALPQAGVFGVPQQLYSAHGVLQHCQSQAPMSSMAQPQQPLRPPGNNAVPMQTNVAMSMVPMQAAPLPPSYQAGTAQGQLVMAGVPAQQDYCQAQPTYMMAAGTSGYTAQHMQQQQQHVQHSNMQVVVLDPAYMPQQVHAAPMQPQMQPQMMCYHSNF